MWQGGAAAGRGSSTLVGGAASVYPSLRLRAYGEGAFAGDVGVGPGPRFLQRIARMPACPAQSDLLAYALASCETFFGVPLAHTSLRMFAQHTHTARTRHTHAHTRAGPMAFERCLVGFAFRP